MNGNKKEVILNYIWLYPGVHRRKIAEDLELRLNLVTDVVKELLAEKWVIEGKGGTIARGRTPIALYVNDNDLVSVSVTYGRKEITCGLVNSHGTVLKETKLKNSGGKDSDIVSSISEAINKIRKSYGGKIIGIGIADPGMIDHKNGVVIKSSSFPDLKMLPLGKMVAKNVGLPVIVEDCTRVLAYGEYLKRPEWRQGGKNLLFLEYGDFLGCTLVTPSGIFRGAGLAGELGHVVFKPDGKYCRCGARGCIETLSSSSAVMEKIEEGLKIGTESILKGKSPLSIKDVFSAYLSKDRLAQNIINEVLQELGMAFSVATAVFHPDIVVVSSDSDAMSKGICRFLESEIERKLPPEFAASVKFIEGNNSEAAVLSGVGLMVFDERIMNNGHNFIEK